MPLTGIISNTARYWLKIAKFIYPTCIRRRNFAKMFSSSSSSSSSRTIYTRHSKSFSGLLVKLEWLGYHMLKKLWWYFIELLHHSRASVPRNKNRERLITVTTVKSRVQYAPCITRRATFHCCWRGNIEVHVYSIGTGFWRTAPSAFIAKIKILSLTGSGLRRFSSPHPSVSSCVGVPGKVFIITLYGSKAQSIRRQSGYYATCQCYSSPWVGQRWGGRPAGRETRHWVTLSFVNTEV